MNNLQTSSFWDKKENKIIFLRLQYLKEYIKKLDYFKSLATINKMLDNFKLTNTRMIWKEPVHRFKIEGVVMEFEYLSIPDKVIYHYQKDPTQFYWESTSISSDLSLTHIPTGITVESKIYLATAKNKEVCIFLINSKVSKHYEMEKAK